MQKVLKLNRPFFFVVQDVQTQVVLITGKVYEPKLDLKTTEELRVVKAIKKLNSAASKFGENLFSFLLGSPLTPSDAFCVFFRFSTSPDSL